MKGEIYFAYGSCMNEADFRRTIPKAVRIGAASLPGYRLDFTTYSYVRAGGAADVVISEEALVEGVLWFVPGESLNRLDAREGAPVVYERKTVDVRISGYTLSAITYSVRSKQAPVRPTEDYLKLLLEGGREAGVDEAYLDKVATHARNLPKRKVYPTYTASKYTSRLNSSRRKTGLRSGYVWDRDSRSSSDYVDTYYGASSYLDSRDTPMALGRNWDDETQLSPEPKTREFFSREEVISGSYGDRLAEMNISEIERMTDEEYEAELEQFNWWNDKDYS